MRTTLLTFAGALLLIPTLAGAQGAQGTTDQPRTPATPAQPATPQASPVSSWIGTVDFGAQITGTTGDEARYERFRDMRTGPFSSLAVSRTTDRFTFDASARKIGFRDQHFAVDYSRPKFDFGFTFAGQPLNFSYITRTPYTTNGSVLTLDDAAQRAVQGPTFATNDGTAVGVPCAPGALPAACSTAAQIAQAKATPSIYNLTANQFDLRYKRDIAGFGATFHPSSLFDVDAAFATNSRTGAQPFGASFAFNNAVEVPKPLDERTNTVTLGTNWGRPNASMRLAYDGSFFRNTFQSLTFDNPLFFSDYTNGLLPPNGPYDVSGYSNGNGPAIGRQSVAPDNSMHVVSASGLYRFWKRTSVNGVAQLTTQNQNDTLIPWTTNSVINQPIVYAAFPHLASLPRATAEAKATGVNTMLSFSSRPVSTVNINVRYRFNNRDVRTPVFDATEYVRFDAVPEENEEGFSPQFDTSRHLFDATLSYSPLNLGTVRVGYGHEAIQRHGRGFADVNEHILRLSWDTYTSHYVTLRASLDSGRRRGTGFVEAEAGLHDVGESTVNPATVTGPGGTQPTLRYFDEADRNRLRGSLVLTVMPVETVDVFVQFAGGRDRYLPDNTFPVQRPGELFGLQNSSVRSWQTGLNFNPGEHVSAGFSVGRDLMSSFQRSRNANPPPDPTWTDPSRDWTLDNSDHMRSANVYVDLLQLLWRSDLRFAYDFQDSDNAFVHGGPRIAALTALNQFIPLPNVTNTWHRASADLQHYFTKKVGVGLGYYYEKLEIVDFSTVDTNGPVGLNAATGIPRIEWLGGLLTGYGNRPYTGNTGFVRLLYRF